MDKIIALVSGLDSFCYLGQYVDKYKVETLTFNYGQRALPGLQQTTRLLDSLKPNYPHLTRRTLAEGETISRDHKHAGDLMTNLDRIEEKIRRFSADPPAAEAAPEADKDA